MKVIGLAYDEREAEFIKLISRVADVMVWARNLGREAKRRKFYGVMVA